MDKKCVLAAVVLYGVMCAAVSAQTAAEGATVPSVSQLKTETRNNLVRLSWRDSPDARGPVYIFKSTQPFNGVIPPEITPVEVAYGSRAYIDETDGSGVVYYFVAASNGQGYRYDVLIPQSNMASVAYSDSANPESAVPVEISGLAAQGDGEKIVITFNISETPKKAVLYRSSHPIKQAQDLLNALIVRSDPQSPYTDRPAPGLSWYYALVFEDEITRGNVKISPGRNATVNAVRISADQQGETQNIRSMPLPAMSLSNVVPAGDYHSGIPETIPLTQDTKKALENIPRSPLQPRLSKKPLIFTRDLETPAGGEESKIREIVQGTFYKRDWDAARTELDNFLSLPHQADITARAYFYRGQTYYFTEKWREALMDFLYAQSHYRREMDEWISSTLEMMISKPEAAPPAIQHLNNSEG